MWRLAGEEGWGEREKAGEGNGGGGGVFEAGDEPE